MPFLSSFSAGETQVMFLFNALASINAGSKLYLTWWRGVDLAFHHFGSKILVTVVTYCGYGEANFCGTI